MPKFLVRRLFEFVPGKVDGVEETPPADLLDGQGKLIQPIAWWPEKAFAIESHDERAALHWAEREWIRQERAICLDARVSGPRFVELQDRRRPGSPSDAITSIESFWGVQEDDGLWHVVG